jgi:hypothetical protein
LGSISGFQKHLFPYLVCFVLLSLGSIQLSAQPKDSELQTKPSVLIASLPVEGSQDQGVRKVLASVMRFQLEGLGIQSLTFATTDEEALVRDLFGNGERDPDILMQSLLEFFSGLNHDFLAFAGYIKKGEEIQVRFYIADLRRGEILASVSRRARIDFALDDAMIRALRDMLPQAEARIAEVVRERAAEAKRSAEAKEKGEAVAGKDVTDQEVGSTTIPQRLPEEPSATAAPGEERFRPFEFSIGIAPFVPVGIANDVFGVSFAPFIYGNIRIPTEVGILGLGLSTGLNIFDAEEAGIGSYFHYVVPVGLDARFTTPEGAPIGLFVRADLGVAINVSDFSSLPATAQEGLSRFLAYGSGGVGAMLAISPSVGIAIDVMYEAFVYFYQKDSAGGIKTDWIMGFVPSIYLYTRL